MLNQENIRLFAARLKAIRSECSLTQDILSQAAGIDRSTLSYYELGQVFPSISKLCLMASLFGISMDELVGGEDEIAALLRDSDEEAAESPSHLVLPTSIAKLTTEEQLLVLYYRQLLEKDRHEFLSDISETAEAMQKLMLDPNDKDIILDPDAFPDNDN